MEKINQTKFNVVFCFICWKKYAWRGMHVGEG